MGLPRWRDLCRYVWMDSGNGPIALSVEEQSLPQNTPMMKHLILLCLASIVLGACSPENKKEGGHPNGMSRVEGHMSEHGKDGPWSFWNKEGQLTAQGVYKDGKAVGQWTFWHKNGQKKLEGNFKDGKANGLQVRWHENGQKKLEANFKDGEKISEKWWNSHWQNAVGIYTLPESGWNTLPESGWNIHTARKLISWNTQ